MLTVWVLFMHSNESCVIWVCPMNGYRIVTGLSCDTNNTISISLIYAFTAFSMINWFYSQCKNDTFYWLSDSISMTKLQVIVIDSMPSQPFDIRLSNHLNMIVLSDLSHSTNSNCIVEMNVIIHAINNNFFIWLASSNSISMTKLQVIVIDSMSSQPFDIIHCFLYHWPINARLSTVLNILRRCETTILQILKRRRSLKPSSEYRSKINKFSSSWHQ